MGMRNWGKPMSKGLTFGSVVVFLVLSSAAARANIIRIDGLGDTGQIIGADEAVAISFQLTQSFTNVSISAPIQSFGASGGLWLQKNAIGPTASFGDVIFAQPFDSSSMSPFATGLTLDHYPNDFNRHIKMDEDEGFILPIVLLISIVSLILLVLLVIIISSVIIRKKDRSHFSRDINNGCQKKN